MLILFILSDSTFAEGGCPPGTYPANPPATNVCNPFPDSQGNSRQPSTPQPQGRWETRWGAIAIDTSSASLGSVVGMQNRRKAEKAALMQCRARGGNACKVDITYYNQCAVMILGNKKYNTASAATINDATKLGMQTCSAADTNCRVYYAECSPPVWVQ